MRKIATLLAALSLAGGAALTGCGSSEDEERRAREQQVQRERDAAERRAAEARREAQERARKLGDLVERQREQDARRARRNLKRKQKSGRDCPGGYDPTLDICFE